MADFRDFPWWAWQGLNLRPLRCQHSAYGANRRKNVCKAKSERLKNANKPGIAATFTGVTPEQVLRGAA